MKISSVFAYLQLLSDLTVTVKDDGACCSHSASHHLSHDWYRNRVPSLSGLGAVGCTERERGAAAALARPPRRPNLLTQGRRLESQLRRCCFVFCWYVWFQFNLTEEMAKHLLFDCETLGQVNSLSLIWCYRTVAFSKRIWLDVQHLLLL